MHMYIMMYLYKNLSLSPGIRIHETYLHTFGVCVPIGLGFRKIFNARRQRNEGANKVKDGDQVGDIHQAGGIRLLDAGLRNYIFAVLLSITSRHHHHDSSDDNGRTAKQTSHFVST